MKKTHTPGPFHITQNTTPGQFVTETKIRDAHQSVLAVLHVNSEGNGPLFAAAPDLLEIAKAYRNLMRTMASTEGELATFAHIESVLAKAEGQA